MKKKTKISFLAVLLIGLLLVFFIKIGWLRPVANLLASIAAPVQKVFYQAGVSFTSFKNYKGLIEENEDLKQELSQLSVDYIRLHDLETENNYLRQELSYLDSENYSYQLAEVIGRQQFNDQILIINKGSLDGLTEGLPATVNQGVIVGIIIKAEEQRSFVQLLTDVKSQLAVSINDLADTNGVLVGRVGNSLQLDFIPQDRQIAEGDVVVSSGLEEKIPRNLFVGRISQVNSIVGQVFKQAKVEPAVNYQHLTVLTIIKSF